MPHAKKMVAGALVLVLGSIGVGCVAPSSDSPLPVQSASAGMGEVSLAAFPNDRAPTDSTVDMSEEPATNQRGASTDVDENTGEARQPTVHPNPHVGVPAFLCGGVAGTYEVTAAVLAVAWASSPWGALASVPFIAWQQAGCPVNTSFALPFIASSS